MEKDSEKSRSEKNEKKIEIEDKQTNKDNEKVSENNGKDRLCEKRRNTTGKETDSPTEKNENVEKDNNNTEQNMENINDIEQMDTQKNDSLTETVRIVVDKHPPRLEYPLELSESQPGTSYATLPHPETEVEGLFLPILKILNTSSMNKKNLT